MDMQILQNKNLLLTAEEMASILSVSKATFWRLHSKGAIPLPITIGTGRCKRWRKDELIAWINAGAPSREAWESMKVNFV